MTKKQFTQCPKCNGYTPKNATFARDENGYRTGAPVYACGLCDHESPRRVYSTKRRRALALAFFGKTLNIGA